MWGTEVYKKAKEIKSNKTEDKVFSTVDMVMADEYLIFVKAENAEEACYRIAKSLVFEEAKAECLINFINNAFVHLLKDESGVSTADSLVNHGISISPMKVIDKNGDLVSDSEAVANWLLAQDLAVISFINQLYEYGIIDEIRHGEPASYSFIPKHEHSMKMCKEYMEDPQGFMNKYLKYFKFRQARIVITQDGKVEYLDEYSDEADRIRYRRLQEYKKSIELFGYVIVGNNPSQT